jgi:hypothetical protein
VIRSRHPPSGSSQPRQQEARSPSKALQTYKAQSCSAPFRVFRAGKLRSSCHNSLDYSTLSSTLLTSPWRSLLETLNNPGNYHKVNSIDTQHPYICVQSVAMTDQGVPASQQDIVRNRLPTLFEVLSRRTLPPVDLFSFYIYMRDQQRSVDYLDFW